MKVIVLLLIFFLVGCNNSLNQEFIIDENDYQCYALKIDDNNMELVKIDYILEDYVDVFNLYTIHQNYLPLGYYVNSSCNIGLIESYLLDNDVYYFVDVYIQLIEDFDTFLCLLNETNKLIGYNKTFIMFK